jgi:beta-glucosidase
MTFPRTTGQIEFNFPFKPGSQAGQSSNEDPNGYGKTSVNGPLYPFGFGLSYTSFEYSNLRLAPEIQSPQGSVEISFDVRNTGKQKGDEVVQLYIRDVISSVIVYESQLRGFQRVSLAAGQTKTIKFIVEPAHLEMLDRNMKRVVEPGQFEARIGSSSVDIRLKKMFTIKKK